MRKVWGRARDHDQHSSPSLSLVSQRLLELKLEVRELQDFKDMVSSDRRITIVLSLLCTSYFVLLVFFFLPLTA